MSNDVIDLDALQPQPRVVKYGDKEITLKPPKLAELIRIAEIAEPLKDSEKQTADQLARTLDEVHAKIYEFVPELEGSTLSLIQILTILNALRDMSIPPDAKELAEKGISVDGDPKAE